MFHELAASEGMPPSPKKSAWMVKVRVIVTAAAQGPSKTATKTVPIGCAVVPPSAGTLNIWIAKQNAAQTERSATLLLSSWVRTFLTASHQSGTTTAYA